MKKNISFNLIGSSFPIIAAIICIPLLIEEIGLDKFGSLTLVWALVGYFGLFDLGMGRSLTLRLVQLGPDLTNEKDKAVACWTALFIISLLAAILALLMLFVAASLNLTEDEYVATWYVSLSLIITMAANIFRGILESIGQFAVINLIRSPLGVYNFVAPLLVATFLSSDISALTLCLVLGRLGALLISILITVRKFKPLRSNPSLSMLEMNKLISYGGWLTVSNMVSPLIGYIDRFVIASMLGTKALSYYVTPQEMMNRLAVIPGAVTSVVFPILGGNYASGKKMDAKKSVFKSSVYLFVLLFPLILILVIYAELILTLWVGEFLASKSAFFLQIFAIGSFLNFMMHIPYVALQGIGLSKLLAKIHVTELILYLPILYYFISSFGLNGAILAWATRMIIDAILIYYFYRIRCA
jgi:O-antigen/teichoic acid export membrane protein